MLYNKTILIISPQSWGMMLLSKHHYAIELAKKNNTVFFLNPPEEKKQKTKKSIEIISSGIDNLYFINHTLWFPYNIKFHAITLFHVMMKIHIKKILKAISQPVDIVWSFDLGDIYPFRFFPRKSYKIFHPVDEPLNITAINSAKGSNIIFSVTREILEKYKKYALPNYFINHGVSEGFFITGKVKTSEELHSIHVGFSGNLLRNDIDRYVLLEIVSQNQDIIFNFFGSYNQKQSNIGGGVEDESLKIFISSLQNSPNVRLHGTVTQEILAVSLHQMDAFLICYDVKKDQSRGTNYHKIMEYISTGKLIVANNITTYASQPHLVMMVKSRENNNELPMLFKDCIKRLAEFNSSALQRERINYAIQNTYPKQIERIEKIIYQNRF